MNDLQAVQKFGRHLVFVLHASEMNVVTRGDEFPVSLKSHRGIVLIRTVVPNPQSKELVERLQASQFAATSDQSANQHVCSHS